jgi:hypothetical protein
VRVAALLAVAVLAVGCFELAPAPVGPKDYLTNEKYTRWVIEVDYSKGHAPPTALLNLLHSKLAQIVFKSTIEFRLDDALDAGSGTWTDAQIRALSKEKLGRKTGGDTVVTHLLFLDGHSEHDTDQGRVLGAAYGHDLIVIFSQSVKDSCKAALVPQLCNPDPYFRAVTMHEFGHALGLVNNGIPMVRAHEASTCGDRPDRHHSTNRNSVMYCQVESSAIVPIFGNDPPSDFDADDRADFKAAGGK